MTAGPYLNYPLSQAQFHEQAAAVGYQEPPPARTPTSSNPFAKDPALVHE